MLTKCNILLIYFKLTLVFFLSLITSTSSDTLQRLSKMNILLPVCPKSYCKPVFATVKAEGGCFDWSVENSHLVNIEEVPNEKNCKQQVIVSPQTNQIDGIAWLVATDRKTKEKFKCKIGFAEIALLNITTRFDTNNVGDLFELQAEARDSRGNLFSSLVGWSFNWTIENMSIVEVKKTIDENKKLNPKRRDVEMHSYSDIILVRGKSVGQIKVRCNIMQKEIENLGPMKQLYIVDPFFISPEVIYVMPRSTVLFQIKYQSGTMINTQQMSHYNWSTSDEKCVSISKTGESSSLDIICTTQINVADNRISDNNIAKATIHVVYPDQIKIGYIQTASTFQNEKSDVICKEYNKEYEGMNQSNEILLIEGHQYVVKYYLFYQDNLVHYSTNSFKFDETDFPKKEELEYCKIDTRETLNAFILKPKRSIEKRESIKAVMKLNDNASLSEEKSLMIHEQIRIKKYDMSHFTLPYLGYILGSNSNKYEQELYLIVSGGSNNYKYSSSKDEVVKISNSILFSRNQGVSVIKVEDEENKENFDEIEVKVSEVKDLSYLEQRQEKEVNSSFKVSVIGFHEVNPSIRNDSVAYYLHNSFTNCTKLTSNALIENKDLIEMDNQNENENNMINIRSYMEKNPQLIEAIDGLYAINSKSSTHQTKKEYLLYSNYGICDITVFKAKAEGIGNIAYQFQQNIPNSHNDKLRTVIASSKASINIYKELTLKHPKFDLYTEEIMRKSGIDDPYILRTISVLYTKEHNFNFDLEHGLNKWNDIEHERSVSHKDIVSLKKNPKQGAINCKETNRTNVEIRYQAKASLTLPRPALSKIDLTINCNSNPKAISIFFISTIDVNVNNKETSLNHLRNIFQIKQPEIHYFVGNDSVELVRVYGFDENKVMILNFIQNKGDFKNQKVYKVITQDEFKKDSSIVVFDESNEFYHNYIKFHEIGKSELIYQSNINNKETHRAILDVLSLPVIEPESGTIYVSNDTQFEFNVKNGSGEFNVSLSDDSLASFVVDYSSNKIVIRPKKTGELKIIATDVKMMGNPVATATLYLVDVKKITLIGGGLLMIDDSLTINIEVIDTFDKQFPIDQLKKINLRIDESFDIFDGLDVSYSNPHDKTILAAFNVTGVKSGLYPITLTVSNVRSNTVTVEVFDRLQIFPPYLLLIPGSSYTLSITGGPQNSDKIIKRFSIIDTNVASIAKDVPEVTAQHTGETSLMIELIYNFDYHKIYNDELQDRYITNNTKSLCVDNVPVRVAFPTEIKIIGTIERQVFTQSTIRLLTAFKLQNETFTYGVGKMKFKWEIQNKESAHIITFSKEQLGEQSCEYKSQEGTIDETCMLALEDKYHEDDSIGIFLQSKQEGIITVFLNVNITYPEYYKKERNVFKTAENVQIGDQVYVNIKEFYGQDLMKSTIYMIPFDVDHELHTSKNTEQKYNIESTTSADSKTVIKLTEDGRITTYFNTGRVYVKITNIDKDKNILPVVLPIFVTDFYSLFVEKTNILLNLEIGQEIHLAVILQHDSGKLFAEKFERMKLKVVESHPKIARAELVNHSSKLKLKALSQGQTHIILFHPISRKIYDVFKITVSKTYHLGNSFTLNIGATIQFIGNDKKKFEEMTSNSIWTSSDSSILSIDPKTGLATAKNEGVSIVQLKTIDEGIIKKMITVSVGKVTNIHIDRSKLPPYLTNISSKSNDKIEYSLPVDFYTSINENKLQFEDPLNIINQNIIFKCESSTSIAKVFERKINSRYECVITMNQSINTKETSIPQEIDVKLSASSIGKKELYSTTERFPFISSFNIRNNVKQLSFTSKGKPKKIFIDKMNDLDMLDASSNDRSLVRIDSIDKSKGFVEVTVPESVQGEFRDVQITIKNTVTLQERVVYASYTSHSNQKTMFLGLIPMDTIVDAITLILLLVIIVILVIYLSGSKNEQRPVYDNGNPSANAKYPVPKGSGLRYNEYR